MAEYDLYWLIVTVTGRIYSQSKVFCRSALLCRFNIPCMRAARTRYNKAIVDSRLRPLSCAAPWWVSLSTRRGIGADFHTAMMATAPGEKLLIRRRPVRNWTQLHCFSLFQRKLLPSELHFLTRICTKSFVGWGFSPDPTGEACSAPPDP